MDEKYNDDVQKLIDMGKDNKFLSYDEINQELPEGPFMLGTLDREAEVLDVPTGHCDGVFDLIGGVLDLHGLQATGFWRRGSRVGGL